MPKLLTTHQQVKDYQVITAITALVALVLGHKVGKIRAYRRSVRTINLLIKHIQEIGGAEIPTFDEYLANRTYYNNRLDTLKQNKDK